MVIVKKVYTVEQLLTALGGADAAALFFGVSKQVLWNWRHRERNLPKDRYFEQRERLRQAGIFAHSGIWFPHRKDIDEESVASEGME